MPDIDLDAIEARANAATPGPWESLDGGDRLVAWRQRDDELGIAAFDYVVPEPLDNADDAEFIAHARTDVPALVALVRAKQSWIDGAKVDMAAMEEERAKALAAVALAGEEIERASVEVKRARVLIRSLVGTTPFPQPAPCPCATVAALDVRPDPSATTDGGAS